MWREAIQQVLISEAALQRRIRDLGSAITADYRGRQPVFVVVLNGALIFLADLIRAVDLRLTIDCVALSSYGAGSVSSGMVHLRKDLDESITGKDVLIIEDIIDTGLTLHRLVHHLSARRPADLRICVLLDRPARRRVDLPITYTGFELPDTFVVGYGLDYRGEYRNLPFIGALRSEVLQASPPRETPAHPDLAGERCLDIP